MRIALTVMLLGVTACGKADIAQSCTMNGFGQGSCSFTNKGNAEGSVCGYIEVTSTDGAKEQSSEFCSGKVAEQSTAQVEFSIPSVRRVCDAEGGASWSEKCNFTFVAGARPNY